MKKSKPSKASDRPQAPTEGNGDIATSSQGRRDEPAQKKAKSARPEAPIAPKAGENGQDKSPKSLKAANSEHGLRKPSQSSGTARLAEINVKGSANKAQKGFSETVERAPKGSALGPGTPHLPTRRSGQPGKGPAKGNGAADFENLSTTTAAFEAQKQALRQKPKRGQSQEGTPAPGGRVKPEQLVKMVVSAALNGKQPETLMGANAQELQDHIMGSFFAGPGFQLPPTPEALPLPSSSLLHKAGKR